MTNPLAIILGSYSDFRGSDLRTPVKSVIAEGD